MQPSSPNDGRLVMEARIRKNWTRKDLAEMYGGFFHGERVSEDTIRMWEEYNKVPRSKKRRYVLARLLNISYAAMGLEVLGGVPLSFDVVDGRVDISLARTKLQKYKQRNHATGVGNTLETIVVIIQDIHDELPYTSGQRHKDLLLLLCDYQQFLAGLFRDRSQYDEALVYQNKAYTVAESLGNDEVQSLVLWRRGLTYHEQGNLVSASIDLCKALDLKPTSVLVQGAIRSSLGHVLAHSATDQAELKAAFKMLDSAGNLLDAGKKEPDVHFVVFNAQGYFLNRASSWVGVPVKKLRSSDNALSDLSLVPASLNKKRRYAYSTYLQARAWFEEGEYPLVTNLARDALNLAGEIKSHVNVNRIDVLHQDLQATNYGNSKAVAELGTDLLRIQHPTLFA